MTKRKHTPGPWKFTEHDQRVGRDLTGRYRITAEARRTETAAMVPEQPELATDMIAILPAGSEYNGPLIAAAPELLEIAEKALEDAERGRYNTSALRAIIAKAKGGISE